MNGDSLFLDLMTASSRLLSAWEELLPHDKEIAQFVYRANEHVRDAIAKLCKTYSVTQEIVS